MSDTPHRRHQHRPSVWRATDLTEADRWTVQLTDGQRQEIVEATRHALAAVSGGGAGGAAAVDRDAFPLPTLGDEIGRWSEELAEGRGFLLVRGFPVDLLSPSEVELAYLGVGAHLGVPVGQNKAGDTLTHILDERLPEGTEHVRRYRTSLRQDFHTDGADIVGLLCLRRARSGGESRIASADAVYNEILDRRPDLLEVLYRPFPWDRQGDQQPGEAAWFELAPLSDVDGRPRFFYIGWYIRDSQRHPDAPRLTGEQVEAMELVESIANDPRVHVEMDFQPGDIQWLNNARILHAREAYDDHDDPERRRHLLRLWLAAHRFTGVESTLRAGLGAPIPTSAPQGERT